MTNTNKNGKFSTVQITTDAMMAAMCAVLGCYAIDFGYIKLSFESLPVLVAALLFGPLDGSVVGFIGTFISQLVKYGVDASTLLWIIPYVIIGLICGFYAKKWSYYNTDNQIRLIVALMEFLLFGLNTVSLYIYGELLIDGETGLGYVLGAIISRTIVAVVKAVGFAFLMPPLLRALHRFRRNK